MARLQRRTSDGGTQWRQDADGIVTIVLENPEQVSDILAEQCSAPVYQAIGRLVAERDSITGVIITSVEGAFAAGANLNEIRDYTAETIDTLTAWLDAAKADFRILETLGVPVVAAINGATLGGGYELALACHHRIALDITGTHIGMPEATFGLLPGRGGVVRAVRMFGIQKAVSVLLQGHMHAPSCAVEAGLVDDVTTRPDELITKAKAWIKANPHASQPWDRGDYRIPGGTLTSPRLASLSPAEAGGLRKQPPVQHLGAPCAILAAAVNGAQVDIETAADIETRFLTELVASQVGMSLADPLLVDFR